MTKSHKEDDYFDHMFEVVLNQDYEDNVDYKRIEHAHKVRLEQQQYMKEEHEKQQKRLKEYNLSSHKVSPNKQRNTVWKARLNSVQQVKNFWSH